MAVVEVLAGEGSSFGETEEEGGSSMGRVWMNKLAAALREVPDEIAIIVFTIK